MHIEAFRDYCMAKKGVEECLPFDNNTLVFKVMGKMFALADIELFESINLKCEPEKALELRENYPGVKPGYHMSKKHWNTVEMDGSIPDDKVKEWIDDSYALIVEKLPLRLKKELAEL